MGLLRYKTNTMRTEIFCFESHKFAVEDKLKQMFAKRVCRF